MNPECGIRVSQLVLSSLKGCLLGGLLGDVFGRPFEGAVGFTSEDVQNYFRAEKKRPKGHINRYSDDTVMTLNIVQSLTEHPKFNAGDMAKRFAMSYISSTTERHYGASVTTIFTEWFSTNYEDLWSPAEQQFGGSGSFGNGAAMRISPIGLINIKGADENQLKNVSELVTMTSLLTHTNPLGVGGAIFQAIAVRNTMLCRIENDAKVEPPNPGSAKQTCVKPEVAHGPGKKPSSNVGHGLLSKPAEKEGLCQLGKSNVERILNGIEQDLEVIGENMLTVHLEPSDKDKVTNCKEACFPYLDKLKIVRELLLSSDHLSAEEIEREVTTKLGNGIAALESVPTALYCFLKALQQQDDSANEVFERTLQLAVSLKGDTDTIASMAGSLAGVFLGVDAIPDSMRENAEGVQEVLTQAERFFQLHYPEQNENEKDSKL